MLGLHSDGHGQGTGMGPRSNRARFGGVVAVLVASLAGLAPAANAGALVESASSCSDEPVSKPFARWGDRADYVLAPGGAFESGSPHWRLAGAGVVAGNESFYVHDTADRRSLRLDSGDSATSPAMCVGLEHPTLRLFARSSRPLLSALSVEVIVETSVGSSVSVPVGLIPPSSSWRPTPVYLVVANLLPLLPNEHTPVAFRFRALGGGSWWIDDFYVDPKRR
jgi:hypothetical protein